MTLELYKLEESYSLSLRNFDFSCFETNYKNICYTNHMLLSGFVRQRLHYLEHDGSLLAIDMTYSSRSNDWHTDSAVQATTTHDKAGCNQFTPSEHEHTFTQVTHNISTSNLATITTLCMCHKLDLYQTKIADYIKKLQTLTKVTLKLTSQILQRFQSINHFPVSLIEFLLQSQKHPNEPPLSSQWNAVNTCHVLV